MLKHDNEAQLLSLTFLLSRFLRSKPRKEKYFFFNNETMQRKRLTVSEANCLIYQCGIFNKQKTCIQRHTQKSDKPIL